MEKTPLQYIFLNNRDSVMCLRSDTYRICKYLATVRISKPVTVSTCTCNTLCIHEGNRKKQQDAVRTADHHALCNRNRISRENRFSRTGIFCWFRNIFSRRLTADYRYFTDDTWSDHRSKFTPGLLRLKEEFGNLIRQTGKV